MQNKIKVLTQQVGWGSFHGFCAFTVGIGGYKEIRRLINNRDQPPLVLIYSIAQHAVRTNKISLHVMHELITLSGVHTLAPAVISC